MSGETLAIGQILTAVGGGLALFLYGMRKTSDAMTVAAGDALQRVLAKFTRNPLSGMLSGAVVTAILQSSSVTTVLAVGFVSAGVMNFSQSIGIIMGANVGTTITAQIVALKVTDYGLPMIALGFLIEIATPARWVRCKHVGIMIMGLGMLFFGMGLMSDATRPLRTYEPFIAFMRDAHSPLVGIAAGAVFTALVQSSSATTGIVVVLAGSGFITLEAGIALVMGANLGTCVTALLAAIGKRREAVRVAVVHVLFNGIGVLIWLPFLGIIESVAIWASPIADPTLAGDARLAAEVPRQLANAHTFFNLANALLLVWFTGPLERLVMRIVPAEIEPPANRPALDPLYLATPAMAVDQAACAVSELADRIAVARDDLQLAAIAGDPAASERLRELRAEAKNWSHDIVGYLRDVSLQNLVGNDSNRVQRLLAATSYLETIAEVMAEELAARTDADFAIGSDTQPVFAKLHALVMDALAAAATAVRTEDAAISASLTTMKDAVRKEREHIAKHLLDRLQANEANRIRAFRRESALAEDYQRLFILARRIAKLYLDAPAAAAEVPADTDAPTP